MTPDHAPPHRLPHRARLLRWVTIILALGIFASCERQPEVPPPRSGPAAPPVYPAQARRPPESLEGDTTDGAPSRPEKAPAVSRSAPATPAPEGTVDFDDCVMFRQTPVFQQFRCKPRGLAIFRDPDTSSLEPAARWYRDLGRLYPPDRWELSHPTELGSATTGAALLQGMIRARKGAAELVVITGTIGGGELAACMLPAALPNARTACQRSVETMQRGRVPLRETTGPR